MPVQARLGRQCCMTAQGSVMKAVLYDCTGKVRKAVLYDCTG